MNDKNEIILYQPDETVKLEVRISEETVWLNRKQMACLFGRDVKTIGKHIANALAEELLNISVVANFATTASDGKTYNVEYYNLDMILSVGYRVKSRQGVLFRQWANSIVRFISCYPNNFFIISVLPKLFKSRIISCLYSFLYQKKNFR